MLYELHSVLILLKGAHLCSSLCLHRSDRILFRSYSHVERHRDIKLAGVRNDHLDRCLPHSQLHRAVRTPRSDGSGLMVFQCSLSVFCFVDLWVNGTRGSSGRIGIGECHGKSGSNIRSLSFPLGGQPSIHHGLWRHFWTSGFRSGCLYCDARSCQERDDVNM
jgi:hypothetical protein